MHINYEVTIMYESHSQYTIIKLIDLSISP